VSVAEIWMNSDKGPHSYGHWLHATYDSIRRHRQSTYILYIVIDV